MSDPIPFLRRLFDRAVAVADPMQALHHALPERPEGRLVVVGAGKASARMAEAVVAVEENADMAGDAQGLLAENGVDNVVIHEGPLAQGAAEHGPYDVIVIQGAVTHLPENLIDQLKEGGRIACLFMEEALGVVRIGYKIDGHLTWRFSFNASAPVLPGFERHAAFTL